jgi:hypothetical protein
MATYDIMISNRDGILASVKAAGNVDAALALNDIEIYKQTDASAIVYLVLTSYYTYDFQVNNVQTTMAYSKTSVTPTGTMIWKLSTAPRSSLAADGSLTVNSAFLKSGTTTDEIVIPKIDDSVASPSTSNTLKHVAVVSAAPTTYDPNTIYLVSNNSTPMTLEDDQNNVTGAKTFRATTTFNSADNYII